MESFVNEQVKRLNITLTQQFEKNLEENNIKDFTSLNEKNQFLFQTIQSLDLTSSTLPTIEKIEEHLEKYLSGFSNINSSVDPTLEWLFVAKCTIAVYGQVFSNLLNFTLPISESIEYWNSIHGNTFQELYYILQSITSTYLNNRPSIQSFDILRFFTLSSFHRRPVILEIISDEIQLKKKKLQQFRSEQAASLGILLLSLPQFSSSNQLSSSHMEFTENIAKEAKECIEMIKYVLQPSSTIKDKNKIEKNRHHFEQRLSSMNLKNDTLTAQDLTFELYKITNNWTATYNQELQCVQSLYGAPSPIIRYWIPAVFSYFISSWVIRYGFRRKEDITHWVEEAGKTAYDFVLNWIWEPVLKVYNTVRLKDQRLSLLSKEGLQSDLDSLERMVVGFAKDKLHMQESELTHLASNVREGDLSVLLKEYEKEIKNPLKNALVGDLLQTILIQVQKTKVDVDLAMSALDKLLKSNELNFAFLAVAPSMLLTWASASWFKNMLQGRSQQKVKKIGLPMRETLRYTHTHIYIYI
ncbi:ATP synthase regulation protein NCA2-domain-containing protein [Cokeromyces recurvatus]|uniref:ATP synthase regulation protein NCA2-domain-containing protein n=1 Tax=Cokeromyces recurvatus TaxID=90255 RepID=UPI00221F6C9B|nr:ATP synthase regulation protein NCA2-domain-containing protein [Cokeromyces recurvatus]KAI7904856.1 ATP synthase regulation protein NCA2-domain-containing protein [Cokeromyces recurvatus]